MQYLLTWIEGEEVCYRFVGNLDFDRTDLEGKNLIIAKIDEENSQKEYVTH